MQRYCLLLKKEKACISYGHVLPHGFMNYLGIGVDAVCWQHQVIQKHKGEGWAQNATGFRTRSQWICLGTPLSINRKQFQFTQKWQTLLSLLLPRPEQSLGVSQGFGKMFSNRKENGVTVNDQELRQTLEHYCASVSNCGSSFLKSMGNT